MRNIKKTSALLLSFIISVTLILTGCSAAVNTAYSQITAAAAPSSEPTVAQTPAAAAPQGASEQLSYVSIDVNPSVRLILKEGVVLQAQAFNDDGEQIIIENDVTGLTPEEALNTLINAFADGGYISNEGDQAALVITACGDKSDELIANLQDAAAQCLTELGLSCDVVVSTVTNTIVDEAKANGLTPGRYLALKYLAEKEGITLEEAKEKYGSLKMGKLVKLLDNVGTVFGHRGDGIDMQRLIDSGILTPEQMQVLQQAQEDFKVAMQQAQEAFKQAKTQAGELWKSSKTEIQNAFKSDKDVGKWKSSKDTLKAQIEQQRQAAIEAFKQAKIQAQEQFRAAVKSLGLTDEQIAALIKWGFDFDWNFDFDWSHGSDNDMSGQQGDAQNKDKDDENKPDDKNHDVFGKSGSSDKGEGSGSHGYGGKQA